MPASRCHLGRRVLGVTLARAAEGKGCDGFKGPLDSERAALSPQAEVAYNVRLARPPKTSPAYGGELTLAAAPGGTVQVTLSDEAWIDLVQGGKVLRSTSVSGSRGCPGLRKSVRFLLAPGPVAISISDAPVTTIGLDVTPVP